MGRHIKIYKISEFNDQHDYIVNDEKHDDDFDFVICADQIFQKRCH